MLIRKQNSLLVFSFVLAFLLISVSYARSSSERSARPQAGTHRSAPNSSRNENSNSRITQPYAPTTLPNGGRVNRNEITNYGSSYNRADNRSRYTHSSHRPDNRYQSRYSCDRYGRYRTNYYYRRSDNVYRYVEVVSSSGCHIVSSSAGRYTFVSLNGYWPGYSYYRYYNYRTYPYYWYITGDSSYQFNTNSYGTFADIASPMPQDTTDRCFEQGVNYFAIGDYTKAADYFFLAKSYAPTDSILPYAYVQALFAAGNYSNAAQNLRTAMESQPISSHWAFYPRGLYKDDSVLTMQINTLVNQASFSSDYQLLAGYQLLGVGRFDEALVCLNSAKLADGRNQIACDKLIYILNNLKAGR
jgi:hypothetical protein